MKPDTLANLLALLRRAILAAIALGTGVYFLMGAWHIGQMLVGLAFFLLAAIIAAPAISRLLVEPLGGLFWPRHYNDKPQPIYSIPHAKRLKGQLEEALLGYEQIVAEHPSEVRPWLEMIDIALAELGDPVRAELLYQRGLAALRKPKDREWLAQVYAATRERQPPRSTRILSLPDRHPVPAGDPAP